MAQRTYHIGLTRRGSSVTVQVADSVDQLSCEMWKYLGERITSLPKLRHDRDGLLRAINHDHGTAFTSCAIQRIGSSDYTAGHVNTARREIAEYLQEAAS